MKRYSLCAFLLLFLLFFLVGHPASALDNDASSEGSPVTSSQIGDDASYSQEHNEAVAKRSTQATASSLAVDVHVSNKGWLGLSNLDMQNPDQYFGTVGQARQLEALKLTLSNGDTNSYIELRAHIHNIGWVSIPTDSRSGYVGTVGKGLGIEALCLTLKGSIADKYDLYYQVHSAGFGWLGWAKNGEKAGSQGYSRSIEAIRFRLVAKGESAPIQNTFAFKAIRPVGLSVTAHVAKKGWLKSVGSGDIAGTVGKSLQLEALNISILQPDCSGSIEFSSYEQGTWQPYSKGTSGTTGKSIPIEALKIRLTGELAGEYDVWYRVHSTDFGWLDWTRNDAPAGSRGYGKAAQAVQVLLLKKGSTAPGPTSSSYLSPAVSYSSHISSVGWKNDASRSLIGDYRFGSTGKSKKLEAFRFDTTSSLPSDSLFYAAYVARLGQLVEVHDGAVAGTTGKSLGIESVHFRFSGDAASKYDIWYRAHLSNYGWLGWACNGREAGSQGLSTPIEAIDVKIVPKGSFNPVQDASSFLSVPALTSSGFVAGRGWQAEAVNKEVIGTTGLGLTLKGLKVSYAGSVSGGLSCTVHVANKGWLPAVENGRAAGPDDFQDDIQCITLSLSGSASRYYNIWYRVHVANKGWLGWTKNGSKAGSEGIGLGIQAVQVRVKSKYAGAPGDTADSYISYKQQPLWAANARQRRIVQLAKETPSPGGGLCSEWIDAIFKKVGYKPENVDACDFYWRYCKSSKLSNLKVGMVIAVPSHTHSKAGKKWGHVCIYIGDNKIMDNIGRIRTEGLQDWLSYYATTYSPKWGWYENVSLI